MIYVKSFILFLFPTFLVRVVFLFPFLRNQIKLGKHCKIGFSLILCPCIELDENVYIGHFNFISIQKLKMSANARVLHLNFIKGNFNVDLSCRSRISSQNKISSLRSNYYKSTLHVKKNAAINFKCLIDCTSDVTIGACTTLAGSGTQVWTHSFYFSKNSNRIVRVDNSVSIGDHCYIGSRCCILPGVCIGNAITVGAQAVVSKSIEKSGLYVSQSLRFIEFDPDEKIAALGNPIANGYIYKG